MKPAAEMRDGPSPVNGSSEDDYNGRPRPARRGGRARQRVLRTTAVLPSLVTVLNGLAGFAAIHFATKDALGQAQVGNLARAVWMIVIAMVFDTLDGRLARITRRTSDFGGQLDSLCDAISFGVAPAMLMLRTVVLTLRQIGVAEHANLERVVWAVAGVYVACSVLRLARFNVENEPDESAHMDFPGLPSPGAAAAVVALVLLFTNLTNLDLAGRWFLITTSMVLPAVTLAVALLMVSRVRYVHIVNQYIRGKRSLWYLVRLVTLVLAVLWQPYIALAVIAIAYALSGPVGSVWAKVRSSRKTPAGAVREHDP